MTTKRERKAKKIAISLSSRCFFSVHENSVSWELGQIESLQVRVPRISKRSVGLVLLAVRFTAQD